MAMLTLNGVLQNVYSQPERKDEKNRRDPASVPARSDPGRERDADGETKLRWSRSRCTRMRSESWSGRKCASLWVPSLQTVASCSTRFATKRSPRRPKEKCPATPARVLGVADFSSIDRQHNRHAKRNTLTRKSATGAQIPHRTTGPAARSNGGPRSRGPTGAPEGGALGSSAKLRATFYDPMESRVQRFALQSVARSILPKAARLNASESGRMTVTSKYGNPRSTARPAMAGCKPAAASGLALCVRPRSRNGGASSCWTRWSCTRPKAARSIS